MLLKGLAFILFLSLMLLSANAGTIPGCSTYAPDLSCSACQATYILVKGQCYSANPLCSTYDLSTGNCLACVSGYILNGQYCINNTPIDPYCSHYSGSVCLTCYPGYYFLANGKCANTCVTFNALNGYCNSCQTGYVLNNGKCLSSLGGSSSTNPQCQAFSNGICTNCYGGYYLNNGLCTLANSQCATYDMNTGYCLSCYPWYYINNTYCAAVNPLCQTYQIYSGDCTSCYPTYRLSAGTCIPSP